MRSTRLPWDPAENALAAVTRAAAAAGTLIDLTASNPTEVELAYPAAAMAAALARAPIGRYEPAPLGLPSARAAVALDYARAGITVDPGRIALTASSSESYGFLFKLCCDPGDAVLVPEPSYPLFEYLARLEGVVPLGYRLAFDGVWHVDFADLEETLAEADRAGRRPRALVVVNPNNPTGSFLKRDELARLLALCARREISIISDEVFAPYPFGPDGARVPVAATEIGPSGPPTFSLGGLSKASGMPQLKLGWILVGGRDSAGSIAALELIGDTFLSVGTPVQAALGELLALGSEVRAAIAARVAANRAQLAAALPATSLCTCLPAEGGWSAILRLPASHSDEAWATALLAKDGVLTHPGYFFDLRGGTFLVVSLIPPADRFRAGIARLLARVDALLR